MLQIGESAPAFELATLDDVGFIRTPAGKRLFVVFFETDCPTCRLALPYLERLARHIGDDSMLAGISQDGEDVTRAMVRELELSFPVALDRGLKVSHTFDPVAVPTLFLLGVDGNVEKTTIGLGSSTGMRWISIVRKGFSTYGGR
jgi:peroxiredoxin